MGSNNLLTPQQAAKLLNWSVWTVYRWCNKKWLPSVRLPNGQLRIRKADVESILTKGKV